MSKNTTPPEGYDVQREQMLDFKVPEQLVQVLDEDGRSDAKNFILTTVDEVFNWAASVQHLAGDLRSGLLCHRDDGHQRNSL